MNQFQKWIYARTVRKTAMDLNISVKTIYKWTQQARIPDTKYLYLLDKLSRGKMHPRLVIRCCAKDSLMKEWEDGLK